MVKWCVAIIQGHITGVLTNNRSWNYLVWTPLHQMIAIQMKCPQHACPHILFTSFQQ